MTTMEKLRENNTQYALDNPQLPPGSAPQQQVAILTCMDVRIDPLRIFGLALGQAHVLRNAGARVTEDVVRSLAVSQQLLGTNLVIVMPHTRCGMLGLSESALKPHAGDTVPPLNVLGISDLESDLQADLQKLRTSAWISPSATLAGAIFDVESGRARVIQILGPEG